MNHGASDWSLCRSFLAILREGSLSAAARALDVAQPTVRRHLEALEAELGTRLFARSPSGLQPTEAALRLRSAAEAMEAAAGRFLREADNRLDRPTGTVRITASEIVASEILPVILAELGMRHAGLAFEIAATNVTLDVLRYEADLAVRMAPPEQGDLLVRKAATFVLGLYAHRRWLARHGAPRSIGELVASGCLIGDDRNTAILRGLAARGVSATRAAFCYRSDSDVAKLAALRAGLGVGICPTAIAMRDPALVRILSDEQASLDAWVVMHPDRRASPAVRVTFEALINGVARFAAGAETGAVG
jgi:DNA-binding transcriptional LysR family regulator